MRGKLGIVIGLAAGYVLGARAGRERYDQIKEQWLKVYESKPVQKQVDHVKDIGKAAVATLPTAVWNGAVKVTKAAANKGTPAERVESARAAGKESAADVATAAKSTAKEVGGIAEEALDDVNQGVQDALENAKKDPPKTTPNAAGS